MSSVLLFWIVPLKSISLSLLFISLSTRISFPRSFMTILLLLFPQSIQKFYLLFNICPKFLIILFSSSLTLLLICLSVLTLSPLHSSLSSPTSASLPSLNMFKRLKPPSIIAAKLSHKPFPLRFLRVSLHLNYHFTLIVVM